MGVKTMKKKNKKRIGKRVMEFLIIISICVILFGTYLLYLSNSKRIFSQAINNINNKLNNIELFDVDFKDYTINSDFEINTNGSIDEYKHNNSDYYKLVSKIIKNYSNTNVNLDYTRNLTNKKLFINYKSRVNNNDLISGKYLIKNNTEYYYIDKFTSTYINNGNNMYFESVNSNDSEQDNLKYLSNRVSSILKSELDIEYLEKKSNNKYTKVTLKLNNKRLNTIRRQIINGLKKDKRSRIILMGYDRDFFKKNRKNIKYLDKNDAVYVNFYANNILYNIYKYEVITKDGKFIYSKDKFKLYKNNEYNVLGKIVNSKNRLNISLFNSKNKKIGNFNLTRKNNSKKVMFYIDDNKLKNTINISIRKHKIKKNSYKEDIKILLSGVDNGKDIYNINLTMKNNISTAKKIKEDTSKSQLDSSLSKDTKLNIDNKIKEIRDKLEVRCK